MSPNGIVSTEFEGFIRGLLRRRKERGTDSVEASRLNPNSLRAADKEYPATLHLTATSSSTPVCNAVFQPSRRWRTSASVLWLSHRGCGSASRSHNGACSVLLGFIWNHPGKEVKGSARPKLQTPADYRFDHGQEQYERLLEQILLEHSLPQ